MYHLPVTPWANVALASVLRAPSVTVMTYSTPRCRSSLFAHRNTGSSSRPSPITSKKFGRSPSTEAWLLFCQTTSAADALFMSAGSTTNAPSTGTAWMPWLAQASLMCPAHSDASRAAGVWSSADPWWNTREQCRRSIQLPSARSW